MRNFLIGFYKYQKRRCEDKSFLIVRDSPWMFVTSTIFAVISGTIYKIKHFDREEYYLIIYDVGSKFATIIDLITRTGQINKGFY